MRQEELGKSSLIWVRYYSSRWYSLRERNWEEIERRQDADGVRYVLMCRPINGEPVE